MHAPLVLAPAICHHSASQLPTLSINREICYIFFENYEARFVLDMATEFTQNEDSLPLQIKFRKK
jgi:hypothetical protein